MTLQQKKIFPKAKRINFVISNKDIVFYCNSCHFKKITKSIDSFKEHAVFSIPVSYDKVNKKINTKSRRKQFKCPKCGYVIIPKFINEQSENDHDLQSESDDDRSK